MKKSLFISFIVICCFGGIIGGLYYHSRVAQIYSQTHSTTSIPITLDIPAIHVHAHIESVGLDIHKQMDVPKDTKDVAWYNLGPEPGAQGNAVIDGHVDTQTGAPAVFAQLKNVKPGEKIDILESDNITHEFVITSVYDVPTTPFPVSEIFGAASEHHLNLITCDGIWDTSANNYTRRLVVFSKLVK